MKKTLVLALAFVFVFGLAATAFAAPGDGVDFGGNVRLRYESFDQKDALGADDDDPDTQKFRIRLDAKAALGEDWKLFARLEATENFLDSGNNTEGTVKFDQLYVTGPGLGGKVLVGRYNYVPVNGLVTDSYFEGAKLSFGESNLKANVYYGREKNGVLSNLDADDEPQKEDPTYLGVEVSYAVNEDLTLMGAYHKWDSDKLNGFVDDGTGTGTTIPNTQELDLKIAEFGFGYQLNSNFNLSGSYAVADVDSDDDTAYSVNLKYKGAETANKGTWGAWVGYSDLEADATFATTLDQGDKMKGYEVGIEYVPFVNSKWTTLYVDAESTETVAGNSSKAENKIFRTQLELFF